MTDEILTEIRQIKEEFAASFNHDLDAMYRYLKQWESESGRQYVNLAKKPKTARKSRPSGKKTRKAHAAR